MKLERQNALNTRSPMALRIGAILLGMSGLGKAHPTQAQILPDTTLPKNSMVEIEGMLQRITGGTQAGSNLFHSFEQFNLDTVGTAYFDNALTIDNIITRVTGGQLSNIDGLIRANGNANLFLLNPSGIIFGPNARLDIGGSFLGSTAESLLFEDGSIFRTTEPNAPPLLTVSVPIGLQFDRNPGGIRVEGSGHRLTSPQDPTLSPLERVTHGGLQVQPGRTLALVGGNVTLDGGLLTAPSGRIDIGSAIQGQVNLTPTSFGWRLEYPENLQNPKTPKPQNPIFNRRE